MPHNSAVFPHFCYMFKQGNEGASSTQGFAYLVKYSHPLSSRPLDVNQSTIIIIVSWRWRLGYVYFDSVHRMTSLKLPAWVVLSYLTHNAINHVMQWNPIWLLCKLNFSPTFHFYVAPQRSITLLSGFRWVCHKTVKLITVVMGVCIISHETPMLEACVGWFSWHAISKWQGVRGVTISHCRHSLSPSDELLTSVCHWLSENE